ncbi:MAG: prolyl oligopeptidase family serine peptidase [Phycisphaerales bacterium]|nr:prolyl oligopeptidase family serine peptidase [Phycisphaerales bacterium]
MRISPSARLALLLVSLAGLSASAHAETEIVPDVVYGHKAGMALTYDVLLPEPDQRNGAGVLFIVSGAYVSRWFDPATLLNQLNPLGTPFRGLLERGYVLYIVRHGSAPKFTIVDAVSDVRLAIEHIRSTTAERSVDSRRLGVTGLSAGGHLSLMLGTMGETSPDGTTSLEPPVAAVVAWFPPTDITPYARALKGDPTMDFDQRLVDSVSPIRHVDQADAPTLLFHGDQDTTVPIEHSIEIRDAMLAAGVPVHLETFAGESHRFGIEANLRSFSMMYDFFDEELQGTVDEETADTPPPGTPPGQP